MSLTAQVTDGEPVTQPLLTDCQTCCFLNSQSMCLPSWIGAFRRLQCLVFLLHELLLCPLLLSLLLLLILLQLLHLLTNVFLFLQKVTLRSCSRRAHAVFRAAPRQINSQRTSKPSHCNLQGGFPLKRQPIFCLSGRLTPLLRARPLGLPDINQELLQFSR